MTKLQPVPGDFLAALRVRHPGETGADVAAAIAEFYEKYPERWAKGYYAIDIYGTNTYPDDPAAVRLCAVGAGCLIYGETVSGLRPHVNKLDNLFPTGLVNWNDNRANVGEVIAGLRAIAAEGPANG